MIVSLVSGKGGCGKSTLAVHLAAFWHGEGRRVLIADCDPQGSIQAWADVAATHGVETPTVVGLGDSVRQQLEKLAPGYDIVVVDTPGRHSRRSAGAMLLSDLVLIPCGPGPQDIWQLGSTLDLLGEVREIRPDLRAAIVVNRALRTTVARGVREALADVDITTVRTVVAQRTAYAESIAAGQGVTAYAGGTRAAVELKELALELEVLAGFQEDADAA